MSDSDTQTPLSLVPRDEDIFVPPPAPDWSFLGDWYPQRLSVAGTIQFTRFVSKLIQDFATELPNAEEQLARNPARLVETVLTVLDEARLYELLQMVSGKDRAWIDAHFDLFLAVNAVVAFISINRLGETLASMRAIANLFTTLTGGGPSDA